MNQKKKKKKKLRRKIIYFRFDISLIWLYFIKKK